MPSRVEYDGLAQYTSLTKYKPRVGDFIVWAGWFRVWFGLISAIGDGHVLAIFEGLPSLLLTTSPEEQRGRLQKLLISEIINSKVGTFAVMQYGQAGNTNIWYI